MLQFFLQLVWQQVSRQGATKIAQCNRGFTFPLSETVVIIILGSLYRQILRVIEGNRVIRFALIRLV